jgi:hypothetical protein
VNARPWADVATFWLPKSGSTVEEYEDASWVGPNGSPVGERCGRYIRLAVSDGASESMLASRWARHLAASFGQARASPPRTTANAAQSLADAVGGWEEVVSKYIMERDRRGSPIQWYEEPGLARGAFATLLVVELRAPLAADEYRGTWRAIALGDSCIFQVRDEQLIASFPVTEPNAFGYSPPLVPSKPADPQAVIRRMMRYRGDWQSGDSFYAATDALAAWFLRSVHTGQRPWEILRDLGTDAGPSSFAEWVMECRAAGAMQNDDVTLVRIDLW